KAGSTTVWMRDPGARPDSVVKQGAQYVRALPGGARVVMDGAGRHVATVSRLGVKTTFEYVGDAYEPVRIRTAHTDAWDPGLAYDFHYDGAGGRLSRVSAPGVQPGTTRDVGVGMDAQGRVTSLTDPDSSVSHFGYQTLPWQMPTPGIGSIQDPRGNWTDVEYSANGHRPWYFQRFAGGGMASVAGADAVTTYVMPEVFVLNDGVRDATGVAARIDGPRTDVADVTWLWLDRFGAPRIVQDALGVNGYAYHDDARFPALVTESNVAGPTFAGQPTRRITRVAYTALGTLDSTVVVNPLGDGRDAVTRYQHGNAAWPELVTQVTSPTGLVSSTGYDAAGNRVWQQAGPDPARRVSFHTNAFGQVDSVWTARSHAVGEPAERVEYDPVLGNASAVTSPLQVRTTYLADRIGRDTLTIAPVDSAFADDAATGALYQRSVTRYDAAGRAYQTVAAGPKIKFPNLITANATPWDSIAAETVTVTSLFENGLLKQVSRVASPDPGGIGTVSTGYRYDALGRPTVEIAPHPTPADTGAAYRDVTLYDPAGNVVNTRNRLGQVSTFTYDALNRLVHRSVPSVVVQAADTAEHPGSSTPWRFPYFAPTAGAFETVATANVGFTIAGEEADFSYDAAGNVQSAVNGDAVVRRTYYPGGALNSETQKLRAYAGPDTTAHVYTSTYTYDLEGRRTQLTLPAAIAATPAQGYDYDPATGALVGVRYGAKTSPVQDEFVWAYDADGRLASYTRNGFQEQHAYDTDGRDTLRSEAGPVPGGWLHHDRFRYDLRGKVRRVTAPDDSTLMGYSGLGTLARSFHGARLPSGTNSNERYVQDALGNQSEQVQTSIAGTTLRDDESRPMSRRHYQPFTGRLAYSSNGTTDGAVTGQDTTIYDAAGNRTWFYDWHWSSYTAASGQALQTRYVESLHSWYGADGRLRVVDRRTCYLFIDGTGGWKCDSTRPPPPNERSAFEEYRYDALGRRVLVRSRQEFACTSRCVSFVRRTVWDGDQVLAEIQAPGQTGTPAATMEKDVGFSVAAASSVVPDTADAPPSSTSHYYPGYYYGRVLYTHGPGIDHPLAITRVEYSDSLPGPITIYPHENWNGSFDLGSFEVHSLNPPCKLLHNQGTSHYFQPVTSTTSEPKFTPSDTVSHCLRVSWPAAQEYLTKRQRDNGALGPESWNGSLVDGMRDASGQMYRRNRYYDPTSSRFTQEDPIGIAGGLNVYGFAGGDPVNYSDPYGLSCKDKNGKDVPCPNPPPGPSGTTPQDPASKPTGTVSVTFGATAAAGTGGTLQAGAAMNKDGDIALFVQVGGAVGAGVSAGPQVTVQEGSLADLTKSYQESPGLAVSATLAAASGGFSLVPDETRLFGWRLSGFSLGTRGPLGLFATWNLGGASIVIPRMKAPTIDCYRNGRC
ncbi:MAG: hypothetical protein JWM27_4050, partial [Gemmatimonadetes bacterium]|nr:hypothetical protein [Gemmatimonadota bacterium]